MEKGLAGRITLHLKPFFLFQQRKRKLHIRGAVCAAGFIYLMSLFIWEIDITGNRRYTDEALEEFLADYKIRPGILISSVDYSNYVCPKSNSSVK